MPVRTVSRGGSRSRRTNQPILASLVLAAGVIGAAIVMSNSSAASGKAEVPAAPVVGEFESIKVPVPAEPVPAGRRLREVAFRTIAYPKHQIPDGAVVSLDQVLDLVTLSPLPAGLPLFRANLGVGTASSNPVLEKIPPGMRAMTIRVDATAAVEGWAGSGSVVDVILVQKDRSTVIAEQVMVLSAERSTSPVEGSSAPNVPSTVTLLVTQEQCLAINTAIPTGKIAFALRGRSDTDSWLQNTFDASRLQNARAAGRSVAAPVRGYAELRDTTSKQRFVLRDDRWVESEIKPEGFFVAGSNRETP